MSDMKVFTVRELDRQPAAVLDACDREGLIRIRRQDGRTYRLEDGFRTYDLLHVLPALLLECDTFGSFDPKASKLASLEGLKISGR
jgi:hypothetical protein